MSSACEIRRSVAHRAPISVVQEGTDEAIDFVLRVLRVYQGETFLHGVCKFKLINAEGAVTNASVRTFLKSFIDQVAAFARSSPVTTRNALNRSNLAS